MKLNHPLYLVEWHDAHGVSCEWESVDDASARDAITVKSVGYMIRDHGRFVVLAPHIAKVSDDNTQVCGGMTIPRKSIVAVHLLSDPTEGVSHA